MMNWLVNGTPGSLVSVDDRGLAYGDGLFETIALRGGRPRFLERHLARIHEGCRRLAIPAPDSSLIAGEIDKVRGSHSTGTIKMIVTRGRGPRGYAIPTSVVPTRIVGFSATLRVSQSREVDGLKVMICRTPVSVNPALAGLKTLNRLENVMACAEWQNTEHSEGLMLDSDRQVIGATMSNVFIARGGRLMTPSLERCGVRGVMRSMVLDTAREAGLPTSEAGLSMDEIGQAEEMFLTNALSGIRPVLHCAGRLLPTGPITRRISAMLRQRGVEEWPC